MTSSTCELAWLSHSYYQNFVHHVHIPDTTSVIRMVKTITDMMLEKYPVDYALKTMSTSSLVVVSCEAETMLASSKDLIGFSELQSDSAWTAWLFHKLPML